MLTNPKCRVKVHAEIDSCCEMRDACQIWFICRYQSNDSNLSSWSVSFTRILKDGAFEHFFSILWNSKFISKTLSENESKVSLFLDKNPKIISYYQWECDSRKYRN